MAALALSDKIKRAANWAGLAPSSHNCQPWRLVGCDRNFYARNLDPSARARFPWRRALVLGIDHSQALSALPSLQREMRMSVGAFALLFYNFLRLQGIKVKPRLLAQSWEPATPLGTSKLRSCEPLMVFFIGDQAQPAPAGKLKHLVELVQRRRTLRVPFLKRLDARLPAAIDRVLPYELARTKALSWHRLDRPQEVERLAQFVAEHAERDLSHREAWQETYRYIDFSGRRGQIEDVGFNIQQLMGPIPPWKRAWYRWALSPALMPISVRLGMARKIAAQIGVLMAQSAALYYLEYSGPAADHREQELLAGGSMLALWLAATEKGLALHPVSVVLQHAEIQRRFQSLLGQAGEIWFFARVGEPVESSPTHFRYRRRVEDFLQ